MITNQDSRMQVARASLTLFATLMAMHSLTPALLAQGSPMPPSEVDITTPWQVKTEGHPDYQDPSQQGEGYDPWVGEPAGPGGYGGQVGADVYTRGARAEGLPIPTNRASFIAAASGSSLGGDYMDGSCFMGGAQGYASEVPVVTEGGVLTKAAFGDGRWEAWSDQLVSSDGIRVEVLSGNWTFSHYRSDVVFESQEDSRFKPQPGVSLGEGLYESETGFPLDCNDMAARVEGSVRASGGSSWCGGQGYSGDFGDHAQPLLNSTLEYDVEATGDTVIDAVWGATTETKGRAYVKLRAEAMAFSCITSSEVFTMVSQTQAGFVATDGGYQDLGLAVAQQHSTPGASVQGGVQVGLSGVQFGIGYASPPPDAQGAPSGSASIGDPLLGASFAGASGFRVG
jgi:hypothetical protein